MGSIYRHILNKNASSIDRFLILRRPVSSGTSNLTALPSNQVLLPTKYDVVVVGGGIVGVASARELLQRHSHLKMAIVEKEKKLAMHQSGNNSGVIHAGIYYMPGSLKAKLCVEGMQLLYQYLDQKQIPYKKVGKLIVATNDIEKERLLNLQDRGIKNKVPDLQLIDKERILEIEPYCTGGVQALWSPHTGIVNFNVVTEYYAKDFEQNKGDIHLNFEVNQFTDSNDETHPVQIVSKNGEQIQAKYVLTCAGLYSDKVAEYSGCSPNPRIVPFRGEYLLLNPDKCKMIKGNIYPVPDPRFPFLGVHFTPRMDGNMWLGPNAVLAFKREGYKWSDINLSELWDATKHPGFRKMASKFAMAGINEMIRSLVISLQVKELQKFVPSITVKDVKRGPSGVRAQALDVEGNLVDDFYFDMGKTKLSQRILHCRNAPSPGATSSLAIAKMVADRLEEQFKLKS